VFVTLYVAGVIVLFIGVSYLGDGEALATIQCSLVRVLPHRARRPQSSISTTSNVIQDWLPCCAESPESSELKPVLRYANVVPHAQGGELCVYGERFGSARGVSTLMVDGVLFLEYKSWADPGEPYKEGHLAVACGNISHWTPGGQGEVRLSTERGVSNGITMDVTGKFSGITTVSLESSGSPAYKGLESVNRLQVSRTLGLNPQQ